MGPFRLKYVFRGSGRVTFYLIMSFSFRYSIWNSQVETMFTWSCFPVRHNSYYIYLFLVYRCGYNQVPGASYHPLDGILGLGKGKSSIVSQLHSQKLIRNVVGHCLSGGGGGFLFFGDDLYDSSRVVWTSMSSDYT